MNTSKTRSGQGFSSNADYYPLRRPSLLTVSEAAAELKYHRNTVLALILSGELPALQRAKGKHYRIERAALEEFQRQGRERVRRETRRPWRKAVGR